MQPNPCAARPRRPAPGATRSLVAPLVALALLAASLVLTGCSLAERTTSTTPARRPPNIILILADDLGVGELGCYGQSIIETPTIDRLAAEGTRFTTAYAGSCVCAPSRCSILTGLDTGHSAIRDNRELSPIGQEPLPATSVTIATLLGRAGYATAAIGKWGLGPPGSSGDPDRHGFDLFFGYLCQRDAHNHCPPSLYRNGVEVPLAGNRPKWPSGVVPPTATYAPDCFRDEADRFITEHRNDPFFLYYATTVPHAALQVPDDSLRAYAGRFDDPAYDGSKGYLAHPSPRAAYAAMVSRLDADIGHLLRRLDALGLADDTIILFTSDNGPTFNGGTDSAFFGSAAGARGLKCQLYEGGIRVPLIVRWPGRIAAGRTTETVAAHWDLFPTIAACAGLDRQELVGAAPSLSGVDLTPDLLASGPVAPRDHLYWEYSSGGGWQAVRIGAMKAVRRNAKRSPDGPIELYDLARDPAETTDVATAHPTIVEQARAIMASRVPSPIAEWNYGQP